MSNDGLGKKFKDAATQAGDFAKEHSGKVQKAMKSDKAEEISDNILDGAANAANKVTGNKHEDTVKKVRDNIDKHIGNE